MAGRLALIFLLSVLSACGGPSPPPTQSPALYTTWGVRPYETGSGGLLINGLTPVDPEEHF